MVLKSKTKREDHSDTRLLRRWSSLMSVVALIFYSAAVCIIAYYQANKPTRGMDDDLPSISPKSSHECRKYRCADSRNIVQ